MKCNFASYFDLKLPSVNFFVASSRFSAFAASFVVTSLAELRLSSLGIWDSE